MLGPFDTMTFEVQARPVLPGLMEGRLNVGGNADLQLRVFAMSPRLVSDPPLLSFPAIARGWTSQPQTFRIRNEGVGPLTITHLSVAGDMERIRLLSPPGLPMTLYPGEPDVALQVVIRGMEYGDVDGEIRITSDSMGTPVHRVLVAGDVQTCEDVCMTPHAIPDCRNGACALLSCDDGWYDLDQGSVNSWQNGCECQAERGGRDIAGNCSDYYDVGWVGDDCSSHPSQKYASGILQTADDIDVFFFRNQDDGCAEDFFTGDSAENEVTLIDGPPGLALCARIRGSGSGCGGYTTAFDPGVCGQREYRKGSDYGDEDDYETTVWVLWRPGAGPVCQPYSLRFSGEN